jgi:hypothetical protein
MLAEGLAGYLAANTGVQAQLGTPTTRSDKGTGIFPTQAPEEVPQPWIVYSQVSGNPLQESFAGTGRLMTSRWRLSCYGNSYKTAKLLAQAVRDAMIGLNGPVAGAAQVEGSWLRLEMDEAEPMPKGTIFVSHLDFMIVYIDGN